MSKCKDTLTLPLFGEESTIVEEEFHEKKLNFNCPEGTVLVTADEVERRNKICQEWTYCGYGINCMDESININTDCLLQVAQKEEQNLKIMTNKVNRLANTSADDCKVSLNYEFDILVLREALKLCETRKEKTKAKHISSRIRQLEKGTP